MRNKIFLILLLLLVADFAQNAFARGGGGGSGGGGGGGASFGGSMSGTGGIAGVPINFSWIHFLMLVLFLVTVAYGAYRRSKKIKQARLKIEQAALGDEAWKEDKLLGRVREIFEKFQNDWSNFQVENMRAYLTEEYYKRMVLELNVLKNQGRQNVMEDLNIWGIVILDAVDEQDNSKDRFVAEISARARDILLETSTGKNLFIDRQPFKEYWTFVRENDVWKLDVISQATENKSMFEAPIADFAKRNNFFFDPDFGWLMMPNKGAIFSGTSFGNSDVNNHVIGYFREKIVEFYTYVPNVKNSMSSNYIVAQAILPIAYNDILVKRKSPLFNFGAWKLRRIQTESNQFDSRFCLWADKNDQVSSFELLTPNFMEKIYSLPFELNIEVVGNVLYFYAVSRKDINYDQMLEVLSWAFDEMKM